MKKIVDSIKRILVIARLKTKSKEGLGEWYNERLKECENCPFNSKNKRKKNFKELLTSFFGNFCTVCGCTIKDKASGYFESCPKGKWREI